MTTFGEYDFLVVLKAKFGLFAVAAHAQSEGSASVSPCALILLFTQLRSIVFESRVGAH
jgi:hypothetical protein